MADRRPKPRALPSTDHEIALEVGNLHDVFLTANLMRTLMEASPLMPAGAPRADELSPEQRAHFYFMSDRGRLERLWLMQLAVLVEAWIAPSSSRVRHRIASFTSIGDLQNMLDEKTRCDGLIAVRDYMAHRDRREYWDVGRDAAATAVTLDWSQRLNSEFGRVFLDALAWAGPLLKPRR